ncbi:MAG TPA: sialidase family protein, partial [Usitatibacter sp.]|nr:sialidase family protein [Usitatibacter sp.]
MRPLAPLLVLALTCGCGGGGGSPPSPPAPAATAPAERAVSGASPFGACGGAGGTLFTGAEVEPHLAVDPRDAGHLVAAWQQDRWSNGSARALMAAASFDGGGTWSVRALPFSACAGEGTARGGDYLRTTDPWLSFGVDGTVFASAVSTAGGTFSAGSRNAVLVSRSTDGGRTWSDPATLIRDGETFFNDKETVTADPVDARFAYAAWDRIAPDGTGASYFARSADGGATWEAARVIDDPGPGAQTIANLVRVLPDGTLACLLVRVVGDEDRVTEAAIELVRSRDRGATWSAPIPVAAIQALGARDPATGRAVRDGSILAQMAVAPDGSLAVAWQDGRFTGERDGIALARSADGGLTWSAPVRVNPDASTTAFTPQVHVRADGTIGVGYYVLRADRPEGLAIPADFRVAQSTDGTHWT